MSRKPSISSDASARKVSKEKVEKRINATPTYAKCDFVCPEILKDRARAKWAELVELISGMKQSPLTDADKDTMTVYCQAWADYEFFDNEIKTNPAVYVLLPRPGKDESIIYAHVKNRNYDLRKLASDTVIRCANNLCLDVVSRAKVGLARVKADEDIAENQFAKLLNRKGD